MNLAATDAALAQLRASLPGERAKDQKRPAKGVKCGYGATGEPFMAKPAERVDDLTRARTATSAPVNPDQGGTRPLPGFGSPETDEPPQQGGTPSTVILGHTPVKKRLVKVEAEKKRRLKPKVFAPTLEPEDQLEPPHAKDDGEVKPFCSAMDMPANAPAEVAKRIKKAKLGSEDEPTIPNNYRRLWYPRTAQ